MKLGIITFHQALNYGAILQTYALQKYISGNFEGTEADIVDYRCPELSRFYSLNHQKSNNPVKTVAKSVHFLMKRSKFEAFSRRYIAFSAQTYDDKSIESANTVYDRFLTGSDQVWNPDLTAGDMNYLLAFAPAQKRSSYAASIGRANFPEAIRQDYQTLLKDYKRISVREETAEKLLRDMGMEQQISVNLDPTLLLQRADWEMLCTHIKARRRDYVLIFTVDYSEELIDQAAAFAKARGLDVLYIGQHTRNKKVTYIPFLSIEKLLALFRDARYVFTNSFHGTVFSIVFHRKFYSHAGYDGRNTRVTDMLRKLDLSKHLDLRNIESETIWHETDDLITQERCKAYTYLKWVITNED